MKTFAAPAETPSKNLKLAYVVMLIAPLFFSTNIIFGRMTISEVAPFTLAFLRWGLCAIILSTFIFKALKQSIRLIKEHPFMLLALGFLGMWVSGAGTYYSLQYTTATNGTLIYTTSPLMIILIERLIFGRLIRWRQIAGILIAFGGVATIVFQGRLSLLLSGSINIGDVGFLVASISWAGYSILFRNKHLANLPIMALFGLVCASGTILLLPFSLWEWMADAKMPQTASAWQGIAGIVICSSLLAFSGFQYGLRTLGASVSGIFMYLLPAYGVVLAVLLLGEQIHIYHLVGITLVLGGVGFATIPGLRFTKSRVSLSNKL